MSNPIPYTQTNESITVVVEGTPVSVTAGTVLFNSLKECIFKGEWDKIPELLTPKNALARWLDADGVFTINEDGSLSRAGDRLPDSLNKRVWDMANKGEDPRPLFRFYERLSKNPSMRSVTQLFDFLNHQGIPFEPDGTFLAYKGVNENFTDCHTGQIDNSPGLVHEMPRNKISDDPNHACHFGFHVGALAYAQSFGARTMIVRVDPENVVCVPYACSAQKMRVCKYEVVGHHVEDQAETKPLESTTVTVDTDGDEDWNDEEEYEDYLDEEDEPSAPAGMPEFVAHESREPYTISEPDTFPNMEPADRLPTPFEETIEKIKKLAPKSKVGKFNKLDAKGLIKESIEDLRKYASAHLKIVGASKLPGGKSALVSRILRVRRKK